MSVRRLAEQAIQPEAFAFSNDNLKWAERKIAEYPAGRQQSAVIPLLWRAQEQEGWVTRAAIEQIAKMLDMPYIRVLEVATFYTQFLLQPVGTRAHVLVCGTTPCMLRGAEDIRGVCEHRINHSPFETNAAGTLSWEEVECLGACVNAPMIMIGNDTYEDLTVETFGALLDKFEAGKGAEVKPGPQIARQFGAAEGGQTTLTEKPSAKRTYKAFPPPPPPPAAPGAVPPAAVVAAAPAPAAVAPAADAPTSPGRKRKVTEESAPALQGAPGLPKASTADKSPAGKVDGGATTGKKTPRKLFKAPAGKADDLKLISGVGPMLERTLNAIGITTYAQVAKLTVAQIAEVEGELNFRGRVARDNWLQQAVVLARGGVEEYRKVFGKDPR